MTELQPICERCKNKFCEDDEIVILNGAVYHDDCLQSVVTISYLLDGEYLGTESEAFTGQAYERFKELENGTEEEETE